MNNTTNTTKSEGEMLGILHHVNGFWVSNEGSKQNPSYHVWVPSVTHSTCDSAYQDLSLAICRCNYLATNKINTMNNVIKPTPEKIEKILALIEKHLGIKLELCDALTGIRYFDRKPYFNVLLKDRLWMSSEYDKLKAWANQYELIRVQSNGLHRVSMFILRRAEKHLE